MQDGLNYVFTHRTFQEYFAAVFIMNAEPSIQDKLLLALDWRDYVSKVLPMLFEMDKDLVERKLIMPALKSFASQFNMAKPISDSARIEFFKHLHANVMISKTTGLEGFRVPNNQDNDIVSALWTLYPDISSPFGKSPSKELLDEFQKYANTVNQDDDVVEIPSDTIVVGSEIAKLILSSEVWFSRQLDFVAALFAHLEEAQVKKTKSISEILFG